MIQKKIYSFLKILDGVFDFEKISPSLKHTISNIKIYKIHDLVFLSNVS